MARLASPRRRRTLRVTAAGALLTISLLLALTSVALAPDGSAGWVGFWAPPVVALALCAALLLHTQLRRERVEHAADRQAQAHAFTETFVARSIEHAAYASRMGADLDTARRRVRELEGTLRLSDARGDEAEHRLRQERGQLLRAEIRIIELEVALERRQCDQIDELAAWPGDEVDTVVDLLAWERGDAEERPSSRTA